MLLRKDNTAEGRDDMIEKSLHEMEVTVTEGIYTNYVVNVSHTGSNNDIS